MTVRSNGIYHIDWSWCDSVMWGTVDCEDDPLDLLCSSKEWITINPLHSISSIDPLTLTPWKVGNMVDRYWSESIRINDFFFHWFFFLFHFCRTRRRVHRIYRSWRKNLEYIAFFLVQTGLFDVETKAFVDPWYYRKGLKDARYHLDHFSFRMNFRLLPLILSTRDHLSQTKQCFYDQALRSVAIRSVADK